MNRRACQGTAGCPSASARAQRIVDRIAQVSGITSNFSVRASDVPNAIATEKDGERYVLYNELYLNQLVRDTGTGWSVVVLFAHEMAHHLEGHAHTRDVTESRREEMEREADIFAGNVLFKLGASLADTTAAFPPLPATSAEYRRSRSARVAALVSGWMRAKEAGAR